ncbi:hypothetical protein GCWU000324_01164 [Kingella oralis ATCC 51147]|uniref:Uncharacterized protein n=1 Tax=Kingella oralis ATCC 51147 TaxID=629741 RepID=C4GG97_9NEIS|nr:hypothetical protein GCWU000324_01164 [Kingella oralis ATCC 51147]
MRGAIAFSGCLKTIKRSGATPDRFSGCPRIGSLKPRRKML